MRLYRGKRNAESEVDGAPPQTVLGARGRWSGIVRGRSWKYGVVGVCMAAAVATGATWAAGATGGSSSSPSPSSVSAVSTSTGWASTGLTPAMIAAVKTLEKKNPPPQLTATAEADIHHNLVNFANCMHAKGFTTVPNPSEVPTPGGGEAPVPFVIGAPDQTKLRSMPWSTVMKIMNSCTAGNVPVPGGAQRAGFKTN